MKRKLYSRPAEHRGLFSAHEVALFSNRSLSAVHRLVDDGVVTATASKKRRFSPASVCYLAIKGSLSGFRPTKAINRTLYHQLETYLCAYLLEMGNAATPVAVTDAVTVTVDSADRDRLREAWRYLNTRDEYIVKDPEVKGGIPIIRETRIDVYSIAQRIAGGDSYEDLVADYPDVPRAAFEAAKVYADTHPRVGRPVIARERPADAARRRGRVRVAPTPRREAAI